MKTKNDIIAILALAVGAAAGWFAASCALKRSVWTTVISITTETKGK